MALKFITLFCDFADFYVKNPHRSLILAMKINIRKANSNGCQTLYILLLSFQECSTEVLKTDLLKERNQNLDNLEFYFWIQIQVT